MASRAQLQAWLDDAELAYHNIQTGQAVKVFVDQNGERVEYSSGSSLRLVAYIDGLKRQLGLLETCGPLRVFL